MEDEQESTIRLIAANSVCDKFIDLITVGDRYVIGYGLVKNAIDRTTTSKFEIELVDESFIQLVEQKVNQDFNDLSATSRQPHTTSNMPNVPNQKMAKKSKVNVPLEFVPLRSLDERINEVVHVIGILKSTNGHRQQINTNYSLNRVLDIVLVDKAKIEIVVSLLNEHCTNFEAQPGAVVQILNVKIDRLNKTNLNLMTTASSEITINPTNEKANELRDWYSKQNSKSAKPNKKKPVAKTKVSRIVVNEEESTEKSQEKEIRQINRNEDSGINLSANSSRIIQCIDLDDVICID